MTLYTGHMIRSWRFMPMLEGLTLSQVNVQVPGITKNQYNHPLELALLHTSIDSSGTLCVNRNNYVLELDLRSSDSNFLSVHIYCCYI